MNRPMLSIGIIFRDNIRSLERCLKALQPLKEEIACELVMADTGSADGSRAIAEKYADILFDFSWIGDFSAARNAVLDRCTGEWYLTVDSDEYLDADISELLRFLRSNTTINTCQVVVRNYADYEMEGSYSDFYALRLVRRSIGIRYQGAIHESWTEVASFGPTRLLQKTIFHHDGYVGMGNNKEKIARNLKPLREKLQKNPNDILAHLQVIESGGHEPDYLDRLRDALALVEKKATNWKKFGPPIFRYAVIHAQTIGLPEFKRWAARARELFPDSYYTRIDIACQLQLHDFANGDYEACIQRGEALQAAYDDYRAGRGDIGCQMFSTLRMASPFHERNAQVILANSYIEKEQPEKALSLMMKMDYSALDMNQTDNAVKTLCILHHKSQVDTAQLANAIWNGINTPEPNEKRAGERRSHFLATGSKTFTRAYRTSEGEGRHAYMTFVPLAEGCVLGTAAAILSTQVPEKITALLKTVERWNELPTLALSHAIKAGADFPLPGSIINIEEMDSLAGGLSEDKEALYTLLEQYLSRNYSENRQTLAWVRGLMLAAIRTCDWTNEELSRWLIKSFAEVEGTFLSAYYTPEALQEENVCLLPALHRLGLYCARAFSCLEAGDTAGYVRLLRTGLASYEGAKPMVSFLLDHTPELQTPPPDPELLALAEKVKSMLAMFAPDDPAVETLKASPVYQKVAYLIETP